MALFVVFLLGVANFAMHSAVLARGRAVLDRLPPLMRTLSGGASLLIELVLLTISMAMVSRGESGWLLGYALYSGGNALGAWMVLSGRL